jgi:hypothetical protein
VIFLLVIWEQGVWNIVFFCTLIFKKEVVVGGLRPPKVLKNMI